MKSNILSNFHKLSEDEKSDILSELEDKILGYRFTELDAPNVGNALIKIISTETSASIRNDALNALHELSGRNIGMKCNWVQLAILIRSLKGDELDFAIGILGYTRDFTFEHILETYVNSEHDEAAREALVEMRHQP